MKALFISLICLVLCGSFIGCSIYTSSSCQYENVATTKNRNVCGVLKDSVVVYPIFVDVDQFHPWTTFDIESTMDSIQTAMDWIQKQAGGSNQPLTITVHQHNQKNKLTFNEAKVKPRLLRLNLSLLGSYRKKHRGHVDSWADKIAVHAAKAIRPRKESKLATKNKVKSIERLIARLRDLYQTDNVALMIFVNGYYENYPSVSLHTYSSGPKAEYSIMTNKNPAIIAHEFLHLFGALDLYPHAIHPNFNYKEITKAYPNEIMRIQHKCIESLTLSPITKYYIGWQKTLDSKNTRMLYHKYDVVEY